MTLFENLQLMKESLKENSHNGEYVNFESKTDYNCLKNRTLISETSEYRKENKNMNKNTINIDAIIFKLNSKEFELWEEFSLTDEEREIISNILNNHVNEGMSFAGTKKEIADYIKDNAR